MKGVLTICVAILAVATLSFGQGYGSISGTVYDPAQAVVPGAQVTVTNTATGVQTKTASLADGTFVAAQLQPGTYQVKVETPGFKGYVRDGLVVQVSDRLTLSVRLEIGQATEAVSVSAEASQLRTEDAQVGEVVNNSFIASLPQLNRNPFDLLRLSGNVQGAETTGIEANQQSEVRINGGRTSSVEYYVDGAVATTGRAHNLTNQTPSMDGVQEFKVVTNGASAEYGRISGGYVELVTKSGTNNFHGSLYEYMFNDMFNANAWEQNALGNKKVHFRQNDYGFTLGGPIRIPKVYNGKNKTFFFVDNEYFKRTESGKLIVRSFPTAAERTGDLSNTFWQGLQPHMYDPLGAQIPVLDASGKPTGVWERTALLGGDGKHVPASLIDPVAAAILKLLPMPNRAPRDGTSSQNNYAGGQESSQDNFRFSVRLDHSITSNQRIALRYTTFNALTASTPVGGPLFTSDRTQSDGGASGNINYDWNVGPTLLFNVRGAVTFNPLFVGSSHDPNFDNSFLPSIYQRILGPNKLPWIRVSFQQGNEYSTAGQSSISNSTTYDFAGTGTKFLNGHALKFGFEHRRYYDNYTEGGGGTNEQMVFMINPVDRYSGDHGFGNPQGRVDGMGSFLMGINNRNQIAAPATRAMGLDYNALFIQDDWKVTPKLTLNLGLRWDREGPTTERHDKLYFWDPTHPSLFHINPGYSWQAELAKAGLPADTPTPSWVTNNGFPNGAILIANSPEFPSRAPQIVDNHQLAPRVGLAYQLSSNTVLRAYGGLMYLPTTGSASAYASSSSSLPLSEAANAGWHASDDGGRHYISTWQNPFPQDGMLVNYTRNTLLTNQQSSADPGPAPFTRNMHMPREYDWMASVQHQLPWDLVVEGGYSANRGLGLISPYVVSHYPAQLVQPQYGDIMTRSMASPNAGQTLTNSITGPTQQVGLLQYDMPYYGNLNLLGSNIGSSTFHSLHLRAEKRLSNGFSILFNYTLSRLFDNVGGPEADTSGSVNTRGQGAKRPQTVLSPQSTWGLSAFDQTHRVSFAYIFEVPIGKGRHWMNSPGTFTEKTLDAIVGGWGISGFTTYVSGKPISLEGNTSSNVNNIIKVNQTYGSYTSSDHNLWNPSFSGNNKQVLISPVDGVTASTVRAFDASKVTPAKFFVLGNLPSVDPNIRQPAFTQTDLSLMKYFNVRESVRLQFRAELQNAFNLRGFGPYNSVVGDPNFGLITSAGNNPRQIQLSLRVMF